MTTTDIAEHRFVALAAVATQDRETFKALPALARTWNDPETRRAELRRLAGEWDEKLRAIRWTRLWCLAHPSLALADHPPAWTCNGPHLECEWAKYRGALAALEAIEAGTETEISEESAQQGLDEAEFVLVHGVRR